MAHCTSQTDRWNFGIGRTRTRGCVHDHDHGRESDRRSVERSAPFMFGGIRPPCCPGDFFSRYYTDFDNWEEFYCAPKSGHVRCCEGKSSETAIVPHHGSSLPSMGVLPAPKPAGDPNRFEIVVRDTTDNRLPAWPENTTWKASIAKNLSIATVIKHITANPGKFMVTVVWSTRIEEELHDQIKLVDIERDALELRVRERQASGPVLPLRRIT